MKWGSYCGGWEMTSVWRLTLGRRDEERLELFSNPTAWCFLACRPVFCRISAFKLKKNTKFPSSSCEKQASAAETNWSLYQCCWHFGASREAGMLAGPLINLKASWGHLPVKFLKDKKKSSLFSVMLPPDKFFKLMVLVPVGGYCESRLPSGGHLDKISTDKFAILECSKHAKHIPLIPWYKNFPLGPSTISLGFTTPLNGRTENFLKCRDDEGNTS